MPPVRRHTATQQDTISEVPEINLDLKHMPYFLIKFVSYFG
jgi:hypothetical protein